MHSARLGLIVPKRVFRRAVDRNRVKRTLREEFRLRRAALPAMDVVVQVLTRSDQAQLRSEFAAALQALKAEALEKTGEKTGEQT